MRGPLIAAGAEKRLTRKRRAERTPAVRRERLGQCVCLSACMQTSPLLPRVDVHPYWHYLGRSTPELFDDKGKLSSCELDSD